MDKRGVPTNTKLNDAIRAGKVDLKNEVNCVVSMFLFGVMELKLARKIDCLQFCADLSMKPNSN